MSAATRLDHTTQHGLSSDTSDHPLWALHIAGPDDWYAAPTQFDAQHLARLWNTWLHNRSMLTPEEKTYLHADAREWVDAKAAHKLLVVNWPTTVWDFTSPVK
jgi:hypothetical protein